MSDLTKHFKSFLKITLKKRKISKYQAITLWFLIIAFTLISYFALENNNFKFFLTIFVSW
ncbi:MAG: hypothetical protein JNJ43_08390 [Anaerolineales bacterium]|nr:hypothetical protein [Anaerolineales bacterium]